jgi:hypothetical protein
VRRSSLKSCHNTILAHYLPCSIFCCGPQVLRLSSKSHWDVPIDIPLGDGVTKRVHMLLHHPTPPAFDGEEGRNLRRNHDEIRLFADYVGCAKRPAPSTPAAAKPCGSASSGSSQGWSRVKGVACDTASKGFSQLMRKLGVRSEANRVQPEVQDPAAYLYDDAGQHGGIAPGGDQGLSWMSCRQMGV